MADQYDRNAKQPNVTFTPQIQYVLVSGAIDICSRRDWRLHAVGCEFNHFHLAVSWKKYTPWLDVVTRLKNVLSLLLGKDLKMPGRRWFVRKESRRRVISLKHFNYLIEEYLPGHSGLFWREGRPVPDHPRASARGYKRER